MMAVKPEGFYFAMDETENKVILAGVIVSQVDKFKTLLNGVHQVFYGSWIRDTRITYDELGNSEELYEKLREEVKKFYSATPVTIRQPYEKRTALKTTKGRTWEERHCTYCEEKHKTIVTTHNTDRCLQKGYDKEKEATRFAGATQKNLGNKEDKAYFNSCAAKHFSMKEPLDLDITQTGSVETATGSTCDILGFGTFNVGGIKLDDVNYAPD